MSKSDREPDRRGSGALGQRSNPTEDSLDLVPVMALHALAYCPRLFYLENVEGQRVELFERRLDATWKHPATRHSLPYRKVIELEVQLLEKEWSGSEGQFAQARLR